MVKVVNLTPHRVDILDQEGKVKLSFRPSGIVARCKKEVKTISKIEIDGFEIPVTKTTYTEVENVPEPKPDTIYIVSKIIAEYIGDSRTDVFIMNEIIRDKKQQNIVIGAKSLGIID